MGMMSEIVYSGIAGRLKTVLDRARSTGNPEIIEFCRQDVWPLYLDAVCDAWESVPNELHEFWAPKTESH